MCNQTKIHAEKVYKHEKARARLIDYKNEINFFGFLFSIKPQLKKIIIVSNN